MILLDGWDAADSGKHAGAAWRLERAFAPEQGWQRADRSCVICDFCSRRPNQGKGAALRRGWGEGICAGEPGRSF